MTSAGLEDALEVPSLLANTAQYTEPMPLPTIALVHDWLTGMRGGEKVLSSFCQMFPSAPIWTLLYLPGKVSSSIADRPIFTSMLQHMPMAAERYRHYLPLFPLFAETHKVPSSVDVVISSSHAVAKAMVARGRESRPFHVCYIHTPMRYVWDMFDEYFGNERVGGLASRFLYKPIAWLLQAYDRHTASRVDLFIANSSYVADRVRRCYGREALVLAPPVDTIRFLALERKPEDWYLVVSALVTYKRVDHAIRASALLNRHLKVVGSGPEAESLQQLARDVGANVEFCGFVSDEDLGDFYRKARALLFPGVEDFGIVPVEAIACGCPVIALGVGGVMDSMTQATAVLYEDPTDEGLRRAMEIFESSEGTFSETALREHAQCFAEDQFSEGFHTLLQEHLPASAAASIAARRSERALSFIQLPS